MLKQLAINIGRTLGTNGRRPKGKSSVHYYLGEDFIFASDGTAGNQRSTAEGKVKLYPTTLVGEDFIFAF